MTTLSYEGIDYNVVYIDPSAETNGDGTTYSTAMNVFPSSYTDKTVYLFRRTDETSKISMPKSGNAGLKYVMLLGMPREGQQFYDLLNDAGVKEAWKDETAKYANLLMNSSSYSYSDSSSNVVYYELSNKTFVANNCYFFRDNDGGSADRYINHMMDIWGGDVKFFDCKFGYTQYNLDDDDYLTNNNTIDNNTSKYPQTKAQQYLYTKGDNVTINGCTFNCVRSGRNISSTQSVYVNGVSGDTYTGCHSILLTSNEHHFQNNIINYYYYDNIQDYSGSYTNAAFYMYSSNGRRQSCKDITINIINPNNNMHVLTCGYIVQNIKVHTKKFNNFTLSDNLYGNVIDCISPYYGQMIDNISYDCTNEPVKLPAIPLISFSCPINDYGVPKSYVKNILVKCLDESDYSTSWNKDWSIIYAGWGPNVYTSSSYTSSLENSSAAGSYSFNKTSCYIIDNINISAPLYRGYALTATCAGIKSNEIKGRVKLTASTLDVNKIYNNFGALPGINVSANTFLRCKDYEANTNNPNSIYNGQPHVIDSSNHSAYNDPQHIYIDKTNVILYDEFSYTSSSSAGAYSLFVCPNYIQNGQFYARNESVFAKTWNVVRTGSTNQASIRFSNNTCSSANRLRIADQPYKGITITPSTIGKKELTAYIALKNILDVNVVTVLKDFKLEVRVPVKQYEDGSISYDYYWSECYDWRPDDSTWSNDTELKPFKMIIPIEVKDLTNPIEIGFSYSYYDTLGVLYFDTDVKIADKV